jgi:hypothetical protein
MLEQLQELAKQRVAVKKLREKYDDTSQLGVSIIIPTCKPNYFNNILDNYMRLNYQNKELLIILNNNLLDIDKYRLITNKLENVRVYQIDENYTIGDCLNTGINESQYNFFAKMDDDDFYGSNYLTDLMNVFKYTDADITGKTSSFVYFEESNDLYFRDPYYEYKYVGCVLGSTILAKKEVFNKIRFRSLNNGEDSYFLEDCTRLGLKIYAADKFNYVCMRHKYLQHHTWKISHDDLKTITQKFITTTNFIPIVTV